MSFYGNLWVTDGHTGKMKGMCSLSTCCNCNKRCMRNATIEGSICANCFARNTLKRYPALEKHTQKNFEILTESIIPYNELPTLNYAFFRIESFGDIANVNQAVNYLNIIRKNGYTRFGWWTKNCDILAKAINKIGFKPNNVQIICSSLLLNHKCKKGYDFVDKTFTVYDDDYIKANNIEINCGGRKCIDCLNCYLEGGEDDVRERKK